MDKPAVILAVDDDEEFLLYLEATLGRAGYEVVSASTGRQARRLLKSARYDLLLCDMRLPDATGLELLAEARAQDALSVGILVTAHSSLETALQAMREGAYDYLVKPCDAETLTAAVRRAVEHSRLKQALILKTEQLERLEKQLHHRSTMIQNVSHELKNPLSVVYGYSAFLLNHGEACKPEDVKRSVESIHSNAERLNNLLEELVDSVRLHNHKVELDLQPVSVAKLCHDAAENARIAAQHRGLTLTVECETDALVLVDAQRVQQVLGNLLSNALKFTPAGGSVRVAACERDGEAVLSVHDTGVGISQDDLPHLFERFYQSDSTRREHPGMGLGLDICRGLVELHRGRIWAQSEVGRGSSFHFTLPPVSAQPAPR